MSEHVFVLSRQYRFGAVFWRAVCSCGWRSALHTEPPRAERAGVDHLKAMSAVWREDARVA